MFDLTTIPGVGALANLVKSAGDLFKRPTNDRSSRKIAVGKVVAKRNGTSIGHFAQINIQSDNRYPRLAGRTLRHALRTPLDDLPWQADDVLKCFEHWDLRPGKPIARRGLVEAWNRITSCSHEADFRVGLADLIERGYVESIPEYSGALVLTEEGYRAIR